MHGDSNVNMSWFRLNTVHSLFIQRPNYVFIHFERLFRGFGVDTSSYLAIEVIIDSVALPLASAVSNFDFWRSSSSVWRETEELWTGGTNAEDKISKPLMVISRPYKLSRLEKDRMVRSVLPSSSNS